MKTKILILALSITHGIARADTSQLEHNILLATQHSLHAKEEARMFSQRAKDAERNLSKLKAELKAIQAKERAMARIINQEYAMSLAGLDSPSYGKYIEQDLQTGMRRM
jgi:hypothetical protein